ncbi:putative Intradiol ring-cleavage dioxygenase [Seiridium cardinale]
MSRLAYLSLVPTSRSSPTDEEGVANFDTTFPGHYEGRATHIHTLLHTDATVRNNDIIVETTFTHIGQTFWDQSVRDKVELLSPYTEKEQNVTLNSDDRVFSAESGDGSDPALKYVQLGDNIEVGFLVWIILAVNTSLTSTASAAAIYYETGSVEQ